MLNADKGWRGSAGTWVEGPADASLVFLLKRSSPKPDQHRKDIVGYNMSR